LGKLLTLGAQKERCKKGRTKPSATPVLRKGEKGGFLPQYYLEIPSRGKSRKMKTNSFWTKTARFGGHNTRLRKGEKGERRKCLSKMPKLSVKWGKRGPERLTERGGSKRMHSFQEKKGLS